MVAVELLLIAARGGSSTMKRTCIKRMHLGGKSISKAAAVGAF